MPIALEAASELRRRAWIVQKEGLMKPCLALATREAFLESSARVQNVPREVSALHRRRTGEALVQAPPNKREIAEPIRRKRL